MFKLYFLVPDDYSHFNGKYDKQPLNRPTIQQNSLAIPAHHDLFANSFSHPSPTINQTLQTYEPIMNRDPTQSFQTPISQKPSINFRRPAWVYIEDAINPQHDLIILIAFAHMSLQLINSSETVVCNVFIPTCTNVSALNNFLRVNTKYLLFVKLDGFLQMKI